MVGKSIGKRHLGTPRQICEDNIKINLEEIACESVTGFIWLRIETSGGLL
jgi:hypothetical protein